jgi:hypothetical protein
MAVEMIRMIIQKVVLEIGKMSFLMPNKTTTKQRAKLTRKKKERDIRSKCHYLFSLMIIQSEPF